MKRILLLIIVAVVTLIVIPKVNFGQAPDLGTAADFVLFSTNGAVTDVAQSSHLTGNVGAQIGAVTGFGNVDGQMHSGDGVTASCAADLLTAYTFLNTAIPDFFIASPLGNGQILTAGVYSLAGATTLNLDLTLDALGDTNAVFIFQIPASFSANANSSVQLANGAKACNVFWKVEGLVSLATGTSLKGTIIANNFPINLSTGVKLEGRALSTAGAIGVDGVLAYTPIGCGSPALMGPIAPDLSSVYCYAIFSADGPVTNNVDPTYVTGDVGTNAGGTTTGFNPLFVTGAIHPVPDGSTAAAATGLLNAYTYINTLPYDIELLYPDQFGNSLVLTPHTYLMNAACIFTDTIFLNALGDANAVFVIKIYGALTTSTYSVVKLINGAQAKNVYWLVDNGLVTISDYSTFNGTIICNNGALNLLTGDTINGRVLTTTGAINTSAVTVVLPPGSGAAIITEPTDQIACAGDSVSFTVGASGTGLTYQWRKGIVDILGATNDTLTIDPVNISDAALDYNVVVMGSCSNDTSINVSLTVNTAPIITSEPMDQTACAGDSVSFTVAASGSGLMYQWRIGTIDILGATNDTLTIDPVNISDAALNYNVVIMGSCSNDTSINVSLTVNSPIIITTEPTDQSVCTGASASFAVTSTGTILAYQWRIGNLNLINGGNISGATTGMLIIDPVTVSDAALNYNVVITGTCGNDTSINVSLSVNSATVITTAPVSQTICEGDSVSFFVVASGSGLTYQWRKGIVNLIDGGNISGATNDTLTINPATISDAANNYNVVVTGGCTPINPLDNNLNSAGWFGILAGTAITSTGASVINNVDVGLSPGVRSSITGFPPATVVGGAIYASDDIAPPGVAAMLIQAKQDLTDAYLYAEGATAPAPVTVAGDQGGTTLAPGIYKSTSTLLIQSGDLTLDAQGDANAVWIFQIASDFTTVGGAGGNVILSGDAQAKNVTWQVGSSATIGNGTSFKGNILALTSITMNTGSTIDGRLLARNGAVVLSGTNIINKPSDTITNDTSITSINVSLSVNIGYTTLNPQTICDGGSYVINGNTYTIAGDYNDTLYSVSGCDSVIVTQLTVNIGYTTLNPQSICDGGSYVFNGNTYTIAGIYNDTLISVTGCDSVIVTQLSVNIGYTTMNPQSICNGGSYVFNGNTYTLAGNYNDTLISVTGCDSIIVTQLSVNPVYSTNNPQAICNGGSYSFNGNTYTLAGNYNDTLASIYGCDSIIVTQLTVYPVYNTNNPQAICDGDSYVFNGNTYTLAGNYNDTLLSVSGCDSVIVTQLTVNPVYNTNNPQTICEGDSYVINGNTYTITGNYSDILTTVNGCDSVIVTQLTVNALPIAIATSNSPVCADSSINLTAATVADGTYSWTNETGYISSDQNPVILASTTDDAGDYTLVVTVNGCSSLPSTITVIVQKCVDVYFHIPEGFSPNGDGINDVFVIKGIEFYPDNTFVIFNRWGNKVFEASPYLSTWDGTSDFGLIVGGNALPIGTYFYVLDLNNGSDIYKGTIYLNR